MHGVFTARAPVRTRGLLSMESTCDVTMSLPVEEWACVECVACSAFARSVDDMSFACCAMGDHVEQLLCSGRKPRSCGSAAVSCRMRESAEV